MAALPYTPLEATDSFLLSIGAQNATREECLSQNCCFNGQYSASVQLGPKCFHAANAEISAYFQNSITTQGMSVIGRLGLT